MHHNDPKQKLEKEKEYMHKTNQLWTMHPQMTGSVEAGIRDDGWAC